MPGHPVGNRSESLSESAAELSGEFDAAPKPLVLVLDDAHRLEEARKALFSELVHRKEIKLVLGLRPGPVTQVEEELTSVGLDMTYIEDPGMIGRLSPEQNAELAEKALGADLADSFAPRLSNLARDCPLLAVLAAELLKRGELGRKDLKDTREFRAHVFEGLLQVR